MKESGPSAYTVAVYLTGIGNITTKNSVTTTFPQTFGALKLDAATSIATTEAQAFRPTAATTGASYVAGQVDLRFVPNP